MAPTHDQIKCIQCRRPFSGDDLSEGLCVECWDRREDHNFTSPEDLNFVLPEDSPGDSKLVLPEDRWRSVEYLSPSELSQRRTWIIQSYNEGASQSDLADILGIRRQSVWRIIERARKRGEVTRKREIPLTMELARRIRRQYENGKISHRELARLHGIGRSVVWSIIRGHGKYGKLIN